MQKEVKTLQSSYISLWFRGLLLSIFGIMNMLYFISSISQMTNGEEFNVFGIINAVAVAVCAYVVVKMQNQRKEIYLQIKNSV